MTDALISLSRGRVCALASALLLLCWTPPAHAQDPSSPVSVRVEAVLPEGGVERYTSAGFDVEIELHGVWLNIGNVTVLAKGDPVPGWNPTSPFAPLTVGESGAEGYTLANLVEGVDVASVDVEHGIAGPLYLSMTNVRSAFAPTNLDDAPEAMGHALFVDASLRIGDQVDLAVHFFVEADAVLVLGAPGFDHAAPRQYTIRFDLRGWFADIDPNSLTHSNNVVVLDDENNVDVWTPIAAQAASQLADPTIAAP